MFTHSKLWCAGKRPDEFVFNKLISICASSKAENL